MDIDSTLAYRPLWFCFRVLAPTFFGASCKSVYIYTLLMHLLVTVLFPVHLLLGLLLQGDSAERFKNLTMSLTCVACSLKHMVQLWLLPQMMEICELLKQLDKCVQSDEERDYYQKTVQCNVKRLTHSIYISFSVIYILFMIGTIMMIFTEHDDLIYLAWFPFNWRRSSYLYFLAFGYQLVSILIEGLQGLTNDIFSPLTLCYLSGHLHMLGIRLSQLGFKQFPDIEVQQKMRSCFQDFKVLMRLRELTKITVSNVQLIQMTTCGLNLCIIVIYVIFYVKDIVNLLYNVVFFAIICIQLFPSCYFASVLIEETELLPNAIYSGNWYEQSVDYQRNVVIFIQMTLGLLKRRLMAGGLIELNLNAFFNTIKMAYSLFAVVMQVTEK